MASRISPITAQLGTLSLSSTTITTSNIISRTGGVRYMHKVRHIPPQPISRRHRKKGGKIEPKFLPGHGEKIFVFDCLMTGNTVYSHDPVINANKALKQIPFNGKKLQLPKIQKDQWRPLAMIQFPEGQAEVGRSVYQRLRECKKLHEYSWGDEILRDPKNPKAFRSKHERGKALNNQRPNTIADMAAVLGGLGKGNRIILKDENQTAESGTEGITTVLNSEGESEKSLVNATIWWTNEFDRNYAKEWSANVTHELFDNAMIIPVIPEPEPVQPRDEDGEPRDPPEDGGEGVAKEGSGVTPDLSAPAPTARRTEATL
ncbi:transcriptional regulation of mitochondrial recombination-domain-containing protein [Xylariaceae sp. FL0255]|nr:transcriptional regulation of mitochondrial recombination-domain-containing protein [Xylariaceae sp. FL0255]